ncbi:MAG: hypothetical protein ACLGID_21130 [Gammaproteobacteria bacterium]
MTNTSFLPLIIALCIFSCYANDIESQPQQNKELNHEVLDMGENCKISFNISSALKYKFGNGGDPKYNEGGISIYPIPKKWNSNTDNLSLSLSCKDKKFLENPQPSGIYDEKTKSWRKNSEEIRKYLAQSEDYRDPEFLSATVDAMRVYDVKTPNAHGWADTSDQLTGDEAGRTRYMSFCLYHGSKALCGVGKVGLLRDGPKGNLMPQTLQILRSIEFLD